MKEKRYPTRKEDNLKSVQVDRKTVIMVDRSVSEEDAIERYYKSREKHIHDMDKGAFAQITQRG